MKEKEEKMHFPKIDDFFTTQEERDAEKLEKVEKIIDQKYLSSSLKNTLKARLTLTNISAEKVAKMIKEKFEL